jgi:hypothetical protein
VISLLTSTVRATTKEALVQAAISRSAVREEGVYPNLARNVYIAGLESDSADESVISLLTFTVRATTKEALMQAAVSRSAVREKGVDPNLARNVHIAGLKQARSTLWKHKTQ